AQLTYISGQKDTWDPFQLNPIGAEKERKRTCFQVAQYLVAVIIGLAVLTSAVVAKGALLVLSTLSSPTSMRTPREQQFYMLMLVFCLVCPNVLVFIKSLWRCAFKSFVKPNLRTMAFICAIECLVSLGTSVLVLVVMPQFDVLTNLFISGGVCIVSAILQIAFRLQRETWKIVFPLCSLILTVAGYCLLGIDYYVRVTSKVDRQSGDCYIYIGIGILSSLLISLCWWENPLQATNRMQVWCFMSYKISRKYEPKNMIHNKWLQAQQTLPLARFAFCAAACHWFGVVACKIHSVKMSFALPVCCTGPAVLLLGLILFITQAQELDGWPFSMLALEGVCMWSGFVTCTYYVWKIKVQRIERTSQLFVRRLYESAFIDLSLLLNTKMKVPRNCVIYLCATMWHETYDEMLKILTSMFRLDRYRGDPKEEHKDCFDFECHIYVDDAFMKEKGTDKRLVNSYVNDLIQVVIEVYRVFTNKEPDDVSIIETPYGGRLMFVMPEGNMLYVHLKDKSLIRNKKRWSQIMYLYYLLGYKGYIAKNPQKVLTHQLDLRRESMISLDGETFILPQYDNDNKRKFISDDNTYILALDGDTDFHPKAVILLVDRLRMYENVGAACGRIHPTGMGPMVWYQKFEYAVGHWLQKTAEHVFGSVLCSPGCFSLFRGSALMDDNVLKRYTTTASQAAEYVQYDQGEDRWLCTLLLQQGWRVEYNAASDAYTNSPQEFKEFYNQRRRWGPSTLANTLDLLHSGGETVKRNTSISRLYIFYQMFTVGSSILGPASVTLMIAGAFQFVFKIAGTLSIIIASVPPVFYIIICFVCKPNTQITIAAIMSVLYAFLMTASFFSIIGDMVMQETFLTPTGVFLISMAIMYMVTAILHPEEFGMIVYGLMYFICIPSGYLLLTIYSLVNMHIVSWGTRESNKGEGEAKKNHNVMCDRNCKLCCWDMKIQITQETEMLHQITSQFVNQAPPHPTSDQGTSQQTASNPENLVSPSVTQEPAVEDAKKLPTDKPDGYGTKNPKVAFNHIRYFLYSVHKTLKKICDNKDPVLLKLNSIQNGIKFHLKPFISWFQEEFLKKLTYANMKRNLQEQIRSSLRLRCEDDLREELVLMLTDTLNRELSDVGPEDVLEQTQLELLQNTLATQARHILKANNMKRLEKRVKLAIEKTLTAPQVQRLDENDFWIKLLDRYLTPIVDTKAHLEEVTRELKSLRNKAVFLYFIINVLWVVATFFLQAIGNDVISIKIPKYYTNGTLSGEVLKVGTDAQTVLLADICLMFLLSFAILLLIQFLAMLYHRVYTFIHVMSYRSSEKNYKEKLEVRIYLMFTEKRQNTEDIVIINNDKSLKTS
uniref:chitin synthase n=1 Tax=Sphaeramia orbicularis TaxID=375764 RepID=A0A672ZH61_9TELE